MAMTMDGKNRILRLPVLAQGEEEWRTYVL